MLEEISFPKIIFLVIRPYFPEILVIPNKLVICYVGSIVRLVPLPCPLSLVQSTVVLLIRSCPRIYPVFLDVSS